MKLEVLNLLALLLLVSTSNLDMIAEWWQRPDKYEASISEEMIPKSIHVNDTTYSRKFYPEVIYLIGISGTLLLNIFLIPINKQKARNAEPDGHTIRD